MLRSITLVLCLAVITAPAISAPKEGKKDSKTPKVLSFAMKSLGGGKAELNKHSGKVVLFVNVASRCGFTPQYEGLEAIYKKYQKKGLVVIGVPCNQFGRQEPGTPDEIATFCKKNYGVTFPLLEKVDVNGKGACELYQYLTKNGKPAGKVRWNFEKFLVDREGNIAGRFSSRVKPQGKQLVAAIEKALAKN